MKKLLVSLMILAGVITFAACNATDSEVFAASDDVFAFQAISATELLAGINPVDTVAMDLSYSLLEEDLPAEDDPIVADEIDILDKYLSMMDLYLGDNNGLTVTAEVSDNPDYAQKVTFTSTTMSGILVTYVLYYNEVLFEETPAVEEDETTTTTAPETDTTEPLSFKENEQDRLREKNFEFEDENDDSILYVLSGLLIIGENEYLLEGKKILNGEEEILIMRSWIDHDNYVKVRYQSEENQMKFFYEIVTDGIIVNKSKVRVLTENGKIMTKLEFVEGDAKGRYDFMTETVENVTYIKVKYNTVNAEGVKESGLIHIIATYDELTGETTYEYNVRPDKMNKEFKYNYRHENRDGNFNGQNNPGMNS
jgi:hypothetical protein